MQANNSFLVAGWFGFPEAKLDVMDVAGHQVLDFYQLEIVKQRLDSSGRPLGRAQPIVDNDRTRTSFLSFLFELEQ